VEGDEDADADEHQEDAGEKDPSYGEDTAGLNHM